MIKKLIRMLVLKEKSSSELYVKYLKKQGVKIGEDCIIYAPNKTLIDCQYPWMITIGDHVRITQGVMMITHDFSWSVLKKFQSERIDPGAVLGASGKITIGNNVFIGINTIITRNVTVGDNVIIGAGSVVTKDCVANSVYAGNPARYIMSTEEFYAKRQGLQVTEAKALAVEYYKRYKKKPPEEVFFEYFMLFKDEVNDVHSCFKKQLKLCGNYEESAIYMRNHKKSFQDFEEFMEYCLSGEGI